MCAAAAAEAAIAEQRGQQGRGRDERGVRPHPSGPVRGQHLPAPEAHSVRLCPHRPRPSLRLHHPRPTPSAAAAAVAVSNLGERRHREEVVVRPREVGRARAREAADAALARDLGEAALEKTGAAGSRNSRLSWMCRAPPPRPSDERAQTLPAARLSRLILQRAHPTSGRAQQQRQQVRSAAACRCSAPAESGPPPPPLPM